jgi:hypothetical protein
MGRSRYTITEIDKPHFLTCTIVEWLPLFTRPALVDIVLNTWRFQQANQGLLLYGYVILENHLHYLAQSQDLAASISNRSPSIRPCPDAHSVLTGARSLEQRYAPAGLRSKAPSPVRHPECGESGGSPERLPATEIYCYKTQNEM